MSMRLEHLSFEFSIFNSTISSCIRHVTKELFHDVEEDDFSFIQCPDSEKGREMRGFVYVFDNCIGFVDGTKTLCFRLGPKQFKKERYCGHHKNFCHSVLF